MKTTTQQHSTSSTGTVTTTQSGANAKTGFEITKRKLGRRVRIYCTDGGAKQAFKDECDINNILRAYQENGKLPSNMKDISQGKYGDFTSVSDYQTSMNLVLQANEMFAALPAIVRDRFQNDPVRLAFTNDPKNIDEMVKLGLATPRQQSNDDGKTEPQKTKKDEKGSSQKGSKNSEASSDE